MTLMTIPRVESASANRCSDPSVGIYEMKFIERMSLSK